MTELLKSNLFLQMSWANGLGSTKQIDIFPSDATLLKRDFQWRLSSATIHGPNSFSLFPGYQRVLLVVEGDGLLLNQKPLLPLEPFFFDGSLAIECSLLNSKSVVDLGLIYRSEEIEVGLDIINGENGCSRTLGQNDLELVRDVDSDKVTVSSTAASVPELTFVYCIEGRAKFKRPDEFEDSHLHKGDALKIIGPRALSDLYVPSDCRLAVLNLRRKKI